VEKLPLSGFYMPRTAIMKSNGLIALAIALSFPLAYGQDFRKTYKIAPRGIINIVNPQGNIKVIGYSGKDIEVLAYKKGPDREFLEVQDNSIENQINLFPRYLQFGRANARMNASVDFEIRAPKSIEYNFSPLKSFSGAIEVADVMGRIQVENVGGSVDIHDVQGLIIVSSVSGKVQGDLRQTPLSSNIWFSSISGSILVRAPSNLNAYIRMKSDAGLLTTDFPIEIKENRYGPGKSAHGKLGAGNPNIYIGSVYGYVSLLQKQ
jgi:hypothetical protein